MSLKVRLRRKTRMAALCLIDVTVPEVDRYPLYYESYPLGTYTSGRPFKRKPVNDRKLQEKLS